MPELVSIEVNPALSRSAPISRTESATVPVIGAGLGVAVSTRSGQRGLTVTGPRGQAFPGRDAVIATGARSIGV